MEKEGKNDLEELLGLFNYFNIIGDTRSNTAGQTAGQETMQTDGQLYGRLAKGSVGRVFDA